jgi:hypothetical protein
VGARTVTGVYLVGRPDMMDRSFHILAQASSNRLPIATKKPRLEAALPCSPIADTLRPTRGTYLLDAWYIPQLSTVSRSKLWTSIRHPSFSLKHFM